MTTDSTQDRGAEPTAKRMRLRYAGTCVTCGASLEARAWAVYDRAAKTVACVDCSSGAGPQVVATPSAEAPAPPPVAAAPVAAAPTAPAATDAQIATPFVGVGGSSARREYERRKQAREQRIRAKHPRIGGLILAVSDEPQTTKAWDTGAKGEEMLAQSLNKLVDRQVLVLHDRRIPKSKANIDHIAVTPTGVYVIDAKRYRNKRPHLRVEGGLFRPRTEKLIVGTRDCTKLAAGVHWQMEKVRGVLAGRSGGHDVPVAGVLCFLDADWPLIGGSFSIQGVDVVWPRKARELLTRPGPVPADVLPGLHQYLAESFPPA